MSRYIVLFGLLAVMGAVYGGVAEVNCGDNQTWDNCGKLCEPSCLVPKHDPGWCRLLECSKFTASCRCDSGLVRDPSSGSCVLHENCPKKD